MCVASPLTKRAVIAPHCTNCSIQCHNVQAHDAVRLCSAGHVSEDFICPLRACACAERKARSRYAGLVWRLNGAGSVAELPTVPAAALKNECSNRGGHAIECILDARRVVCLDVDDDVTDAFACAESLWRNEQGMVGRDGDDDDDWYATRCGNGDMKASVECVRTRMSMPMSVHTPDMTRCRRRQSR
jgi:hypothetical protein